MHVPLPSILLALVLPLHGGQVLSPIPDSIRTEFRLAPFYQKCLIIEGFPIVSSAKTHDAAVEEAGVIVRGMLGGRKDILLAMAKDHIRLGVMATSERTCDLPEHSDLTPAKYWNERARGLGASHERPAVSCAEENLLSCSGDPYDTENILVHEFAHAIHLIGLAAVEPTFDGRLTKAYEAAMAAGKWKNCYAAEEPAEYWAEAVQSWFGTNRENDSIHNHVNTRAELEEYDPALAKLCADVFTGTTWQYCRADDPARKDEAHLKNLDRGKLPEFKWTESGKQDAGKSGKS